MVGNNAIAFGTLLRRHRLAIGATQARLAERATISERAVTDLERDPTRLPRLETARLLADALDLSPQERATFLTAAQSRSSPTNAVVSRSPTTLIPASDPALPFVGRMTELAMLENHLRPAHPPVLMLAGEPGIGKSRLLIEIPRQALVLGWQVLAGGCQRGGNQEPYAPLLEALTQIVRHVDPAQRAISLQGCAWLARLLPELTEDERLAGQLDIPTLGVLSPAQERRLIFESVARFLINNAGTQGTLLVLDDLQWAGTDALDLLTSLARSTKMTRGTPSTTGPSVRIIGAYRDTEVQSNDPLAVMIGDLAQAGSITHHTLAPLAPDEAAALVNVLLPLPRRQDDGEEVVQQAELRARLVQRTGGVPFFIVSCAEALAATVRDGIVYHTATSSTLSTRQSITPDVVLPWTVTQSVHQRIARLVEGTQGLLGAAAVVGRDVPLSTLVRVTGRSDEEILDALDAASKLHLLEDNGTGGFRFSHDIVREVLEANLASARRAMLHERVARVLEQDTETATSRPVEALAYHYSCSGATEKAMQYLELAGDHALAQLAHATAERYYHGLVRKVVLVDRPRETARTREKWSNVLRILGRLPEALDVLEQARAIYQAASDQDSVARTIAGIGLLYQSMRQHDVGIAIMKDALKSMDETVPSPGLMALYTRLAHSWVGDDRERLALSLRGESIARQLADTRAVTQMLAARGYALLHLGRIAEARTVLLAAWEQAEMENDLEGIDSSLLMLVELQCWAGDLEDARRMSSRMLAVARQLGDPARIMSRTWLAHLPALFLGDWTVALGGFEAVLEQYQATGIRWGLPNARAWLGRLYMWQGKLAEAKLMMDASGVDMQNDSSQRANPMLQAHYAQLAILQGHPDQAHARLVDWRDQPGLSELAITFLLMTLAWADLEQGDLASARNLVDEAERRAREQHAHLVLVETLRVKGLVALREARFTDAENAVQDGLTLAHQIKYLYMEGCLLHLAGELFAQTMRPALAREHCQAALSIFNLLGAMRDIDNVYRTLASSPIGPTST